MEEEIELPDAEYVEECYVYAHGIYQDHAQKEELRKEFRAWLKDVTGS